jgi:hypothetical protein
MKRKGQVMKYETPEAIDIGLAEDVVLGALKLMIEDDNGTGIQVDCVDEDIQQ